MTSYQKKLYLLVNFGGPRELAEIPSFLEALLTDKDVIRTKLPQVFHNLLFKRVAKKRAVKISHDYALIGGRSPIYEDTESIAQALREKLQEELITFHRYIPATHKQSLEKISRAQADTIIVFPMFPQFTYATTGSIARFFCKKLPPEVLHKMRWVKSYPTHPAYIALLSRTIRESLLEKKLKEEEVVLLFSAHGLPKTFIESGDLYQSEVESSYQKVMEAFPKALGRLSYQSKFGPGEWLRPYTDEVCQDIANWNEGRKNVVFVPISFTSDHIETLFEVESLYMPLIAEAGCNPYRVPAFNRRPDWLEAITQILIDTTPTSNSMLIRQKI